MIMNKINLEVSAKTIETALAIIRCHIHAQRNYNDDANAKYNCEQMLAYSPYDEAAICYTELKNEYEKRK